MIETPREGLVVPAWADSARRAREVVFQQIGDDRERLDAQAPRRIDDAIALLSHAGWLDGFDAG